jgi:hypothetical protein
VQVQVLFPAPCYIRTYVDFRRKSFSFLDTQFTPFSTNNRIQESIQRSTAYWQMFGERWLVRSGLAFVEVLVLWGAIAATMVAFWRRSTIAGVLFLPYLAWVSFAAVLNFAIWRLNG